MAHLDLKPENIMLCSDYNPGIIDFGLGQRAATRLTTRVGTPEYETPESKNCGRLRTGYDPKPVDIFNLG
jgi:serine/threonine protein kinase